MKLTIDHHKFLCIEHPEITKTKQYTYQVSGYQFSDRDKGIIVLHKKEFKIINLKHLGDGMNIIFIKKESDIPSTKNIDKEVVEQGYGMFMGFDEVSGEQKYFWPGASKNTNSFVPAPCTWDFGSCKKQLSFLYGLTILYGKFETKKGELLSIKIQIPLFGQYLSYQEKFDQLLTNLQKKGFFLKKDLLQTNNGIIYQIASNDWELLEIYAKWHETIEKFEKISKKIFTQEMKNKLLAFLVKSTQIPQEGKQEILEKIQSGTIKFLTKN